MNIKFFKIKTSEHKDERREIFDIVLEDGVDFSIKQIKKINFSKKGTIIGNHYHTKESGRIEVYIAIGDEKEELFKFFYREDGKIKEKILFHCDGCIFFPECTHAFSVLSENAELWGLSNLSEYNPDHDVRDILIE